MHVSKVELYKCGKCNKFYTDESRPNTCCEPSYCETCGVETKPYFLSCDSCRYKRMFDKAELVEWDGIIAYDIYSDRYYHDLDEVEHDYDPGEAPEFLFACGAFKPQINADQILDDLLEGVGDLDIEISLVDAKEFEDFVEQWNAKQEVGWYEPNYKKKVRRSSADT